MYTFELKNKVSNGSRSPKLFVEVFDSITGKHADPTEFYVQIKETGNRGCLLADKSGNGCSIRTKNGDYIKEDCYNFFDRNYQDKHHIEVSSLYHFPASEMIRKLKKKVKFIKGIPLVQIKLIPIKSYHWDLACVRNDPSLKISYA